PTTPVRKMRRETAEARRRTRAAGIFNEDARLSEAGQPAELADCPLGGELLVALRLVLEAVVVLADILRQLGAQRGQLLFLQRHQCSQAVTLSAPGQRLAEVRQANPFGGGIASTEAGVGRLLQADGDVA